jgi:glutaredoxin 3
MKLIVFTLLIVALVAVVCADKAIEDEVKDLVKNNRILVFSKSYCPYCKKAKLLLDNMNESYHAVELDQHPKGSQYQAALQTLTGQRTVPNIWINGKHIGGSDNLHRAYSDGTLNNMLKQHQADEL